MTFFRQASSDVELVIDSAAVVAPAASSAEDAVSALCLDEPAAAADAPAPSLAEDAISAIPASAPSLADAISAICLDDESAAAADAPAPFLAEDAGSATCPEPAAAAAPGGPDTVSATPHMTPDFRWFLGERMLGRIQGPFGGGKSFKVFFRAA